MSIYATLWALKFPSKGDLHHGCGWVRVIAQGVPAHIGSPTQGCGYEDGDPCSSFLPPPVDTDEEGNAAWMRAVVFITEGTPKGTERSAQEYVKPLLVLTGEEYAEIGFDDLHGRICDALRGGRPRVAGEFHGPDGSWTLFHDDGSAKDFPPDDLA